MQSNGKLEQHIPAEFSDERPPVLFTHTKHATAIAENPLASQLPEATTTPAILGDPRTFDKLMRGPAAPKTSGEYLSQDIPQLAVHIESFSDATLVSVSWPHTFLDVMGIAFVLQAWQAARGGPEDDIPSPNDAGVDPLDAAGRIPVGTHHMSQHIMNW